MPELIHGYLRAHPETKMWFDQPVANYAAAVLSEFETKILSRCTSIADPDPSKQALHRNGMIHFWPAGTQSAKRDAMAHYLARLREETKRDAA
jgi:hypothetical protein